MILAEQLRGLGIIPASFFATLAMALSSMPLSYLVAQKICSPEEPPFSINEFICNDTELIAEASEFVTATASIGTVTGAISTVVCGLWRDATGSSKPLIIIGQSVHLAISLLYLFIAWDWPTSPWIPAILASTLGGLFGDAALALGTNCNIIENSKPEDRTVRLQFFYASILLAYLLSSSIGGFILAAVGYIWTFVFAMFLHIFALFLIIVLVNDKKKEVSKSGEKWNLLEKLKTIFKSRPNNAVFWMMLIGGSVISTIYSAEGNIQTYYFQQAFHFTINESTIYSMYRFLVPVFGSITMPLIFSKIFKWSDFTVGIVSTSLTITAAFLNAFAKTRMFLYIITPLNLLKFVIQSVPAAVFTKCIKDDELGLYIGFMSIVGLALPIEVNYLYNYIFSTTSQTMPGAYYLITAFGCIIMLVLFSVSSCLYKEQEQNENEQTSDNGKKITHVLDEKITRDETNK